MTTKAPSVHISAGRAAALIGFAILAIVGSAVVVFAGAAIQLNAMSTTVYGFSTAEQNRLYTLAYLLPTLASPLLIAGSTSILLLLALLAIQRSQRMRERPDSADPGPGSADSGPEMTVPAP